MSIVIELSDVTMTDELQSTLLSKALPLDQVICLATGELYRVTTVSNGGVGLKRMTKTSRSGWVLRAGEARYMPTDSCKVVGTGCGNFGTAFLLQYERIAASEV